MKLKHTLEQVDLKDIKRTFHTTAAEDIFFSSAHSSFHDKSYDRAQNKLQQTEED